MKIQPRVESLAEELEHGLQTLRSLEPRINRDKMPDVANDIRQAMWRFDAVHMQLCTLARVVDEDLMLADRARRTVRQGWLLLRDLQGGSA